MKNNDNLSIFVADDHPILLKGLVSELLLNNYNVVGQASDGMMAFKSILSLQPELAILDIDMPILSGFDVIKLSKEKGLTTKFILLSFHRQTEFVTQAKALNIKGYLLKEDSFLEIERCIEMVAEGGEYFSSSFNNLAINNANKELVNLRLLTASEKTILKLIAKRKSTQDIANELFVSTRTIEKHRSNIINKLNISGGTNSLTKWSLVHKPTISTL